MLKSTTEIIVVWSVFPQRPVSKASSECWFLWRALSVHKLSHGSNWEEDTERGFLCLTHEIDVDNLQHHQWIKSCLWFSLRTIHSLVSSSSRRLFQRQELDRESPEPLKRFHVPPPLLGCLVKEESICFRSIWLSDRSLCFAKWSPLGELWLSDSPRPQIWERRRKLPAEKKEKCIIALKSVTVNGVLLLYSSRRGDYTCRTGWHCEVSLWQSFSFCRSF